ITLSLIGIIVLQLSWIKNRLLLKEDQTIQAIDAAVYELSQDLIEEKSRLPTLISPKMIQDWPKERLLDLFKMPTIAERYTAFKMQDKIRKSLERHGLKKTSFEFAIVNAVNSLTFEMQSGNFERAYEHALEDTANNRIYYLDITPLPGSETESLVPSESVVVVFPEIQNFIFSSLGWMIAGAILFTLIILAAFYITVRALLRQKKLSEIKSDFINNMTHELKTPLATISLAVDAIRNPKVVNDPEKLHYFSSIIKDENKRMNKQVETILQAALLDKQEVQLRLKELNVHNILAHVADNFKLQMDERKGKLVIEPEAQNDLIEGDDVHITNMLSNLVDNAIKYSKEDVPPVITISTMNYGKYLRVRIEDNGIGMNKETVSRIFEKFYR
ncbi:MAG: sensor histidine kinase, partial [Sphingobacteriales bacterium]